MALASDLIQTGLDASKPSSGYIAGRLYFATDTNKLYRDSGSAWVDSGLGAGGGGGGLTELAYGQATSNVSVTGTSEGGATVVVTAPSVTFAGTPVEIEFFAPAVGLAALCEFILHDDTASASLGFLADARNNGVACGGRRRLTPAAGARVYSIRAWESGGSTTVYAGAGGAGNYVPAFIRIVG